jgi:thiol-disulfide isomerase/thioredoxin
MFGQQAVTNRESQLQAIGPTPAVSDTLAFRNSVPDFEVRDLSGRTWSSRDLPGKLTVVQIWGTFCIPCRQEHPALQEFFNKARSMKNVQVLTVSVDDDRGPVQSYMKEKGFTFPVIMERELDVRLFPEGGLPESWVIGPSGRRADRFQSWTFGRVLLEVEKMAMAK